MTRITLQRPRGGAILASFDPNTGEVTFDSEVAVTGEMWRISPEPGFVKIIKRDGKYYLEEAA